MKSKSKFSLPVPAGISYSTINSSLSMSSLCDHWPWRTTASNERVKGLGDKMKQTHKPTWNSLTTSLLLRLWRTKGKRRVKSCNLSKGKKQNKNKHWATSWHLLDKTEWRGEKEEEASGVANSRLGQREEAPHPSLSPPFPFLLQGQSLSVTVRHVDWAHLDFSYSILTPSTHPSTHHSSISLPWCCRFNWPSI